MVSGGTRLILRIWYAEIDTHLKEHTVNDLQGIRGGVDERLGSVSVIDRATDGDGLQRGTSFIASLAPLGSTTFHACITACEIRSRVSRSVIRWAQA